jgi:hypothetical protein
MKAVHVMFLLLSATVANAAENLVVPVDIYEIVKARGCNQVADFFRARPSVEEPPYAVHVADLGDWEIAVWGICGARPNDRGKLHTLLLRFDDQTHPFAKCPDRIDGISFIGGLSFLEIDEPAEWYYFLDTRKKATLKGKLKTKAISSVYDGTGDYFVCIDGRWAARNIH